MKKWIAYFAVCAMCISMTACGNGKEGVITESGNGNETSAQGNGSTGQNAADEQKGESAAEHEAVETVNLHVTEVLLLSDEYVEINGNKVNYGYIDYPEIKLEEAQANQYPQLAHSLEESSEELKERSLENLLDAVNIGYAILEDDAEDDYFRSCYHTSNTEIYRSDSAMVNYLIWWYGDFNGVHPDAWYESLAFDAKTGETLAISDVISGAENWDALPEIILEHLVSDFEPDYVFTDEDKEYMLPVLTELAANDALVWTLSEDTLRFYFGAYELMYYAFGPITSEIALADYPGLIVSQYDPALGFSTCAESGEYDGRTESYTLQQLQMLTGYMDMEGDIDFSMYEDLPIKGKYVSDDGRYIMITDFDGSAAEALIYNPSEDGWLEHEVTLLFDPDKRCLYSQEIYGDDVGTTRFYIDVDFASLYVVTETEKYGITGSWQDGDYKKER